MPEAQSFVPFDAVLERTRTGQCEMLSKLSPLGAIDRRLLAIVNGYTPLMDILGLLGEVDEAHASVMRLLDAHCIKIVKKADRPAQFSTRPMAWRSLAENRDNSQ